MGAPAVSTYGPCCCPEGITTASSLGPLDRPFGESGFNFLHRLTPADIGPLPEDPGWTGGVAPYWDASLLDTARGAVTDLVGLIVVPPAPIPAGTAVAERQLISRPMRPGIQFGAAVAWMIIQCGAIVGTVAPNITLRIVDFTGAIVRAVLLPVGNHGTGVNYAGSNNYLMPAVRAPLAAYTSQDADRLVLEMGGFSAAGGQFQNGYGSRAVAPPSLFEVTNHVMGFQNVGNPGARCPYLELDGLVWP